MLDYNNKSHDVSLSLTRLIKETSLINDVSIEMIPKSPQNTKTVKRKFSIDSNKDLNSFTKTELLIGTDEDSSTLSKIMKKDDQSLRSSTLSQYSPLLQGLNEMDKKRAPPIAKGFKMESTKHKMKMLKHKYRRLKVLKNAIQKEYKSHLKVYREFEKKQNINKKRFSLLEAPKRRLHNLPPRKPPIKPGIANITCPNTLEKKHRKSSKAFIGNKRVKSPKKQHKRSLVNLKGNGKGLNGVDRNQRKKLSRGNFGLKKSLQTFIKASCSKSRCSKAQTSDNVKNNLKNKLKQKLKDTQVKIMEFTTVERSSHKPDSKRKFRSIASKKASLKPNNSSQIVAPKSSVLKRKVFTSHDFSTLRNSPRKGIPRARIFSKKVSMHNTVKPRRTSKNLRRSRTRKIKGLADILKSSPNIITGKEEERNESEEKRKGTFYKRVMKNLSSSKGYLFGNKQSV